MRGSSPIASDGRGLSAQRTTAIDAAGAAFRFGSLGAFADGSRPFVGEDIGQVDGDGRIAVIYAFAGRLPEIRQSEFGAGSTS